MRVEETSNSTIDGEGRIAMHLASGLVAEYLLEVDGGIDRDDVAALGQPGIKRGDAVQAPVWRAVILALQPGVKARIEIIDAGQLIHVQRGQELLADSAEEPLDLATTGGLAGSGVHQHQT